MARQTTARLFIFLWLAALPLLAWSSKSPDVRPQGSLSADAGCSGSLFAHALAPAGGLRPDEDAAGLTARGLFFLALSDFAYVAEFGSGKRRGDVSSCLEAWGAAKGSVEHMTAKSHEGKGTSHVLVFRTNHDIFLSFRGLDSYQNLIHVDDDDAPVFDAEYFGAPPNPAAAAAAAPGNSNSSSSSSSGGPGAGQDADALFVLHGYLKVFQAMEQPLLAKVQQLVKQMPTPSKWRLWFTGHSDGSQLAQLAAIRLAKLLGADRVGGVLLFGPARIGSRGWARHYNAVAGNRTWYWSYGRDPALNALFRPEDGLSMPGRGFIACPVPGQATEEVLEEALDGDAVNRCSWLPIAGAPGDLLRHAPLLPLPGLSRASSFRRVTTWEFLAHHMPSVAFDSMLRVLQARGRGPSSCQTSALQLPQCLAVSNACGAALRPAGSSRCHTCGDDAACESPGGAATAERGGVPLTGNGTMQQASRGGAEWVCDNRHRMLSGWMCYRKKQVIPPTLLGLLLSKSSV